ncbi:MAG: HutD family protein [Caldilineaceae bacterium]
MQNGAIVQFVDQSVATWRGGITRAIYAYPPNHLHQLASAHVWVGTATIERDCAYSVFPNRRRIHLPMRGNGLHLRFRQPDAALDLPNFTQTSFAGDRPLDVTLLDRPVEAFNLLFHPTVQAEVRVLHLAAHAGGAALDPLPPAAVAGERAVRVIYAVNGVCRCGAAGGQSVTLQAGDAFVHMRDGEISVFCGDEDADVVAAMLVF